MYRSSLVLCLCCSAVVLASPSEVFSQKKVEKPKDYNPSEKKIPTNLPTALQAKRLYGQSPQQLEAASQSAFLRSLMPLEDHLRYLAMARDARLSGSDLTQKQKIEAWGQYRAQIAEIVPRMQQFNQPGATGWASELAWAKYAITRADQRLAELQENSVQLASATSEAQQASQQLLSQTEFDYGLGMSTLSDLTYAKDRYLASNDADRERRLGELADVKAMQEVWNQRGAGIGRSDKILETEVAQNLLKFQETLKSGEPKEIAAQMSSLDRASRQHFQTSVKYFKNGTAPLHQLTNSILLRQRLQQLQREAPELANKDSKKAFQEDWNTLQQAAASKTDRRGRIQADLLAIDLLSVSVDSDK